jgi:hypothetical protein
VRSVGTVLAGICALVALFAVDVLADGVADCASPATANLLAGLLLAGAGVVAALTVSVYIRRSGAVIVLVGQVAGTAVCVTLGALLAGATSC